MHIDVDVYDTRTLIQIHIYHIYAQHIILYNIYLFHASSN